MNAAQLAMTELETSSAALPEIAARLETPGAGLEKLPPEMGDDALLADLFAQYTMERERDVHRDLLRRFGLISKSAERKNVADNTEDDVLLF